MLSDATNAIPFTGPEQLTSSQARNKIVSIQKVEQLHFNLSTPSGETTNKKSFFFAECYSVSVILCGGGAAIRDELKRSFHDALCVVRNLIKLPSVVLGGGVVETGVSVLLTEFLSVSPSANEALTCRAFAQALLEIPITLIQNASMHLLSSLTDLIKFHQRGHNTYGVDVLRNAIADMKPLSVVEPLLNKRAQFTMATEAAISILKINDMIIPRSVRLDILVEPRQEGDEQNNNTPTFDKK